MARAIICDDREEGWLYLLDQRLSELGHNVVGRCGSPEALRELAREHSPVLVVCDLHLAPHDHADGFRLAEELREAHPGTSVLIVSTYNVAWLFSEIISAGTEHIGYLLKPTVMTSIEALDEAVAAVQRGEYYMDEAVAEFLEEMPIGRLSPRQRTILTMLVRGLKSDAIGAKLNYSVKVVERELGVIYDTLGVPDPGEYHRRIIAILNYLAATGIIDPP